MRCDRFFRPLLQLVPMVEQIFGAHLGIEAQKSVNVPYVAVYLVSAFF